MTGVSDTSAAIASVATPGSTVTYATSYAYDPLNRPTGVTFGDVPAATAPTTGLNVAFTHAYNAVNQRTGQSVSDSAWIDYPPAAASTTAYTANSLNQYTAVGAVTPGYDSNGNTTSDGTSTLGYDAENRLTSASKTGMTASYTFDGRGRRKAKTVNGTTTVFVTDADNREVLEYDGNSGAILRWYAYGLGSNDVLAQMDVSGGTRLTPVPDLQGSIIATMSNAGTLTSFAYRAYGASASAPAQFGYTGQRVDAETGSYYYRARAYSPGWGRFWQADPIGYGDGTHLYAYVGNDPLNLLDPDGFNAESSQGNTLGRIGAAASALASAFYRDSVLKAADDLSRFFEQLQDAPLDTTARLLNTFPQTRLEGEVATLAAAIFGTRGISAEITGLAKSLNSDSQVSEILSGAFVPIAGAGTRVAIKDEARLVAEYGGSPGTWQKISSASSYTAADGVQFQTRAYRNVVSGQILELKTVPPPLKSLVPTR
jgi:RHS repeat-associated protein